MPQSTERGTGFGLSKWELNYLKCRYVSHRNKVGNVKPAIDCTPPEDRPHVRHKKKKALFEKRRQTTILAENLRVLNKTAEIMQSREKKLEMKVRRNKVSSTPPSYNASSRELTEKLKRSAHVLLQWFIQKYGTYVPWWAEINY